MDLFVIELICWGGLVFFFWALKDGLGKVEADIESLGLLNNTHKGMPSRKANRYCKPEAVREMIGSYAGEPIYRFAVIDGRTYQFDRVCASGTEGMLDADERCMAPGLVYIECDNCRHPLVQA
jgi:hypothetical protein